MNLDQVEESLILAEKAWERESGVVAALASRGSKAAELAKLAEQEALWQEEAARLLNQFSDEKQKEVLEIIQTNASIGLTQVFGEPIELTITPVVRARRLEFDVRVKTGNLETPILEARGGGLAAVAGFIIRVSVLLLTPEARRLLVLDEVFAMLSEEYVPRMGDFIRDLCEQAGLQVILVTHQPEFKDSANKVYRIEKVKTNTAKFVEET